MDCDLLNETKIILSGSKLSQWVHTEGMGITHTNMHGTEGCIHINWFCQYNHFCILCLIQDVLGKDVFNEDVKSAVAEGYFFLADIFIAKEEEMMKEKEEAKGGWRGWKKLVLMKKEVETPLHTSFFFAPENGGNLMTFLPGQYISIRILGFPYLN